MPLSVPIEQISAASNAATHAPESEDASLRTVFANGALPIAVTVSTEHDLLSTLEARLAGEVRNLCAALLQFSRITQGIGEELPLSSNFGKNVTLFLSLGSLHVAQALLQRPDAPLLVDDGAQQLGEMGLSLDEFVRELNLDGRRFLAVALVDKQTRQVGQALKAGNAG
jgi:hypothetical protein